MCSYAKLRAALDAIPIVDDHSHVLHHNIIPPVWEGPYEVLPLSRLLLDFNTRLIYLTCGIKNSTVNDILLGRIPPEEQKKILLSYPQVNSRNVVRFLIQGINRLYGLKIDTISEENWDTVNAAVGNSRQDFYGLLEKVFAQGNIKTSILNLHPDKCYLYCHDYREKLTERELALDQRFFRFSNTLDSHALRPFGPIIALYAKKFNMPQETLADYEALLERICRWSVEEIGACAFKNTEMYFRRLDYRVRSYEEAAPCYKPERTAQEETILSDYIACIVFRMAGQLGVPVQIHTGSIWGDFVPADTSPEHLANIVGAFPETKFDLLHGGDPFFGTMALMGSAFPNVYVNMSSIPCHSTANFEHWLDIYLDRVPTGKLTIGWDLFTPEILCGAASAIRDSIARVLAKKVDAGLYPEELALEFAKDIMYRSAEKLFGR